MTTPESIRALVERLEALKRYLLTASHGTDAFSDDVGALDAAAAALTALMAERDEARAAFSQASKESAESILLVASASRRAAFTRAREIAEEWIAHAREEDSLPGALVAGEIASAIAAEMQSEEQKT